MTALPIRLHSDIIEFLQDTFKAEMKRLKLAYVAKRDAGVRTGEYSARIPDLIVIQADQWLDNPQASAVLQVPPLLVVEVVSPSTKKIDYRYKQSEYAATRIPEYWIVDPEAQTVSILTWDDGLYEVASYKIDEQIQSSIFPELNLTVEQSLQGRKSY